MGGGHKCLAEYSLCAHDVTQFMGKWVTLFVREKLPCFHAHSSSTSFSSSLKTFKLTCSVKDAPHPARGDLSMMAAYGGR